MKYRPEYPQMLADHLKQGFSFKAFGGVVYVTEATLHVWAKTHQEFGEAKDRYKLAGLYILEKMGFDAANGDIEKFQAVPWIFMLKNRYGWVDKQEIKTVHEHHFVEMRKAIAPTEAEQILLDEKKAMEAIDVVDIEPLD